MPGRTTATDPPKPQRRLDRTAAVPASGTKFYPRSRRGLRHCLVVVRCCPYCQDAHTFRDDGLRIASCGLGYLMVKARKARTAKPAAPDSGNLPETASIGGAA